MDHFQAVGELGLGSRLKRLSDIFMVDVKKAYESEGYDFEPRWFPLFSLLLREGPTTVSAAAEELKITHPHISQMAKELEARKLISFKANQNDGRSRDLFLTAKGRELGERIHPLWNDIRNATQNVVHDIDVRFLERLAGIERLLEDTPFEKRIQAEKRKRILKDCKIIFWQSGMRTAGLANLTPVWRKAFESLNREWIEEQFEIEPHDLLVFKDPEKEILQEGGEILFAEVDGEIVGTCALIHSEGKYELAKLAVTKKFKGLGLGELLCAEIGIRAKEKGARALTLTTNSRLIPAVRLYEKLGFQESFRGPHPEYKRVDLTMEKRL